MSYSHIPGDENLAKMKEFAAEIGAVSTPEFTKMIEELDRINVQMRDQADCLRAICDKIMGNTSDPAEPGANILEVEGDFGFIPDFYVRVQYINHNLARAYAKLERLRQFV